MKTRSNDSGIGEGMRFNATVDLKNKSWVDHKSIIEA